MPSVVWTAVGGAMFAGFRFVRRTGKRHGRAETVRRKRVGIVGIIDSPRLAFVHRIDQARQVVLGILGEGPEPGADGGLPVPKGPSSIPAGG